MISRNKTLNYILFIILILIGINTNAQVNLLFEDFEDNTFEFTVSDGLFHDGNNDYFSIIPLNGPASPPLPAYTSFNGLYFFAAEDMDDGGTRPETQTLTWDINISGYSALSLDVLFAAAGNAATTPPYDDEESFKITAQIDGGTIQNLLAFEAVEPGGDLTNNLLKQDTDFDGIGDPSGFQPSSTFTQFNALSITGTGNSLKLVISFTSTDTNTELAMDDVKVTGMAPANAEIDVQRPASSSIIDGGTDDLGDNVIGATSYIYTIANTGSTNLTVSDVTATGLINVSGFSASHSGGTFPLGGMSSNNLVIAPGTSADIEVDFTIDAVGAFSFDMDISSDDADENPYDIAVSGTGIPPEVSVAVVPASAAENSGTDLVYTFTRTGDTSSAITVNFSIGGTATFTTDYTISGEASYSDPSGTITIPANSSSADLTVSFVGDTDIELDETIIVTVDPG